MVQSTRNSWNSGIGRRWPPSGPGVPRGPDRGRGAAHGIDSIPGVTVVDAPGGGDTIVQMAKTRLDVPCPVVTANRQLRQR
ncbi:hypothetical protein [Alloactinosynnema sp. L-07]|nr:hypothetical protein [Alloactinosynnema sp. L-07]